jgi:hypothetical protein
LCVDISCVGIVLYGGIPQGVLDRV